MSREDILKALRLCNEAAHDQSCPENCPYHGREHCIRKLLDDTFAMVAERIQWKEIRHGGTDDLSV